MSMHHPSDPLREDEAARQRALDVASFIVEAPAGAGKTELLTQRTLRLLAVVDHPEEVLALTFTNKAATEMRDRILGSLALAVGGARPELAHKQITFDLARAVLARDAERGWALLDHPGRLRITTLDALCASLARQMPYLSRFGAQPGVADEAGPHYQSAARRTLEMLEGDDAAAQTVAAALAFMDNHAGRLESLLVTMLGRRDQWVRHVQRIADADFREEVAEGFARLIAGDLAVLAALCPPSQQMALMPLVRFAAANGAPGLDSLLDWTRPLRAELDDLPGWRALAGLLLTGTGGLRKAFDKRVGFPADAAGKTHKALMLEQMAALATVDGLEAALNAVQCLPPAALSDAEWSTVEAFSHLLQLAVAQLWLVFQEVGEVDFIEIAARASLALGEDEAPTDLAQALDYRIRHLLVDEFQDTSPTQVELLRKLTQGWVPGDGRTLFVVGDPMQSIYRFRKADVGTFLTVRARGIGDIALENLRLYRNNRSFPPIVDWVNQAFPGIFPAQDHPPSGAVRYAPSLPTRPATVDSSVAIHPLIVGPEEDAAGAEARQVLALIQAAQRSHPDEEIAVLVRARSHLDALVAEIRRTAPGLRFQAVEIEGLDGRQHVQDVLALQYALWHRADRVNWLAVLRAPWCGLTLADLYVLAGDDRQSTLWQLMQDEVRIQRLSADGQRRLRHLRAILHLAFAERGRQHPRRWLEAVWLMLDGPATLDTPGELADIDALFALLDKLAARQQLNAEALAEQAARLFAPPDPLADGHLQMMTIHKSKGLEFHTVILPGLHRDTGQHDSSLLLWEEVCDENGVDRLLVAPMPAREQSDDTPTLHDYLRRLEDQRSDHETARLLYVAATRAIRQLHLVGVAEPDSRGEALKKPRAGSLLDLLWPRADATFLAAWSGLETSAARQSTVDSASFIPPLRRLARIEELPELRRPPLFTPPVLAPNDAESATLRSLEASVGTLVHRYLELLVGQNLQGWDEARLNSLRPRWHQWLRAQGHDAAAAESGASEVGLALVNTLNSPQGRWLLADHPEGGVEQAWTTQDGDATANHVIDRCFIADGQRWIIDYKTQRSIAADDHQALRREANSHRAQLCRYARLFAGTPEPVKLAIFFPLQGQLVEVG